MHKALLIDPRKCTSCMQCELACSFEHTGAFNPARSRIKIFEFEHGARSIPYTCTQCEEAWCLHACPVEAITVNPATGAKEVDPRTSASAARSAPSPAPSAPSTTAPTPGRW